MTAVAAEPSVEDLHAGVIRDVDEAIQSMGVARGRISAEAWEAIEQTVHLTSAETEGLEGEIDMLAVRAEMAGGLQHGPTRDREISYLLGRLESLEPRLRRSRERERKWRQLRAAAEGRGLAPRGVTR